MDVATMILSGGLMLLIGIPIIVGVVLVWQLARIAVGTRRRGRAARNVADDEGRG